MSDTRNLSAGNYPLGPWVEIVRGRTSFPHRPVRGDRFLIGAGSQCDLQLGGPEIPMLHSLIVVHPRGVTLEAFAPTPDLLVNGEKRRSVTLRHHDRVEIGRVELRFHNPAEVAPLPTQLDGVPDEVPVDDPSLADPIALTAEELTDLTETTSAGDMTLDALVERLEEERQAAQELADRRASGAAALLDAIRRAGEADDAPVETTESAEEPEVDALPMQVVDAELEERERQLLALEETLAARAAGLALVQDRLVEQIGQIREQVRQLEGPGESEPLRISA